MPVTPVLHALAGIAVLSVAVLMGEAASIGGVLGVLLLLSAAVRFAMARGT